MPPDHRPSDPHLPGLLEQLAGSALLSEAEDLTRGVRYLSVTTGDPETDDELSRINAFTAAAWRGRGAARTTSIRGGNDHLTLRIEGEGAAAFVDELVGLAEAVNPGFWRIARSPHPPRAPDVTVDVERRLRCSS